MSKRGQKNRTKAFDTQFVGITVTVLDSPAWKVMSPHARIVYLAIKRSYSHKSNNNGRLYLAGRSGSDETGFSANTIWKCIRELVNYGFAVVTKGATIGPDGVGSPTLLRLTEMGTHAEPTPTRDFLKWDGVLFDRGKAGAGNLPPRPKRPSSNDDQAGNGAPGFRAKNKTPHHSVRHPAPSCEAPPHHSVRHGDPEPHHSARHMVEDTAPFCEAHLVLATTCSPKVALGDAASADIPPSPLAPNDTDEQTGGILITDETGETFWLPDEEKSE
jgi:hypothetical protein